MRIFRLLSFLFLLVIIYLPLNLSAEEKVDVDLLAVVQQIHQQGDTLLKNYSSETAMDIGDGFSNIYFDIFEASGMELTVGMHDPELKTALESQFSQIIGHAMKEAPKSVVIEKWLGLKNSLLVVAEQLKSKSSNNSFWTILLQAFLILLREGFEAILVVTALIAYLKRSAPEKVNIVWYGVGAALIASLFTAWAFNTIIKISGAQQEALEGITMLIAAMVLFYVSYWLISKRQADRWNTYIRQKIDQAVSKGSLYALGFAAFLAVYREGAETVLFYQAMAANIDGQYGALMMGIAAASLCLLLIYWLMYKTSTRLPLGTFFTLTAVLLYYLAFTFVGKGVLELQEARWVSITPIDWMPQVEWLGIFPTLEASLSQLLFLLPLPIAWYWFRKKGKNHAMQESGA